MASTNKTTLGLCLWDGLDHVKRLDFVGDNLLIDALISALQDGKADKGHTHSEYLKEADAKNDYINAVAGLSTVDPNNRTESFYITKHVNCPTPTKYYYILNLYLAGKTTNRAQIAIEYDNAITATFTRTLIGNAWTAWQETLTKGNIEKGHVGLDKVENLGLATRLEAEAGVANNKYMTPLRVFEGIAQFLINGKYVNRQSVAVDFNSLTGAGWHINTSSVNAPISTKTKYAVLIFETEAIGNTSNITQIAYDKTDDRGHYMRQRVSGIWGAWQKVGFYNTLKEQVQLGKNITIPSTAWTFNSAVNNWEATITDSRIKSTDNVDINVQVEYLYLMEDAGARGATKEFNGFVKIYALDKPAGNIVVNVVINREVI